MPINFGPRRSASIFVEKILAGLRGFVIPSQSLLDAIRFFTNFGMIGLSTKNLLNTAEHQDYAFLWLDNLITTTRRKMGVMNSFKGIRGRMNENESKKTSWIPTALAILQCRRSSRLWVIQIILMVLLQFSSTTYLLATDFRSPTNS